MNNVETLTFTVFSYLTALAIAIARPMALFTILPVMARLGLPRFLQTSVAMAVSMPVILQIQPHLEHGETRSAFGIASLCFKEAFIGLMIGIVIAIPFLAIETAGNIVDFVRQAPDSEMQDPQGTSEASITGTLFAIVATLYFVAMGGMSMIADIIYRSYEIWPALDGWPHIDVNAFQKLLALLDKLLRSAMVIGAPLIIVIMISLFILLVIARFVPQINVFDLSMSFRNAGFAIAIQIYAVYILSYFSMETAHVRQTLDMVQELIR